MICTRPSTTKRKPTKNTPVVARPLSVESPVSATRRREVATKGPTTGMTSARPTSLCADKPTPRLIT